MFEGVAQFAEFLEEDAGAAGACPQLVEDERKHIETRAKDSGPTILCITNLASFWWVGANGVVTNAIRDLLKRILRKEDRAETTFRAYKECWKK